MQVFFFKLYIVPFLYFWFFVCTFGILSKKSLSNSILWILCTFFFLSAILYLGFIPSWVNFSMWCKIMVKLHSFACFQSPPHHLLASFSLLSGLGILVEEYLTIYTSVYFWALCSIPLVYLSVFMPTVSCFDYCALKAFILTSFIYSLTRLLKHCLSCL